MTELAPRQTWRDLDLSFAVHPFKKDVLTKQDRAAVFQHLDLLLHTQTGDLRFRPDISAGALEGLFENASAHYLRTLQRSIELAIRQHEPRIEVRDVSLRFFSADRRLEISIQFVFRGSSEVHAYKTFLRRVR